MRALVIAMSLMGPTALANSGENAALVCSSEDTAHPTPDGRRSFYEILQDSQGTTVYHLGDPEYAGQERTTLATFGSSDVTFFSAKRVFHLKGFAHGDHSTPVFSISGVDLDRAVIDNVSLYVWTYVASSWTFKGQTLGPITCTYAHHYQ